MDAFKLPVAWSKYRVAHPIMGIVKTTLPMILSPQAHRGSGFSLASPLVLKQLSPAGSITLWTMMLEPPLKTMISPGLIPFGGVGVETTTSPKLMDGAMLPLLTAKILTPKRNDANNAIDNAVRNMVNNRPRLVGLAGMIRRVVGLEKRCMRPDRRIESVINGRVVSRTVVLAGMTGASLKNAM